MPASGENASAGMEATSSDTHAPDSVEPPLHPLGGADWATFRSVLRENGPYDPRKRWIRMLMHAVVLARVPFYRSERRLHDAAIRSTALERPPIFLVGHWRSGTTHTHNLLSQDPQFAWINFLQTAMPWDFLGKLKIAPPIIERFLPQKRGMDNVDLSLDSPQEEEMALGNLGPLCYYYCYYFPRRIDEHYRRSILFEGVSPDELSHFADTYRFLLRKLTYAHEGRQLLLKNPASTARIRWLKEQFPNARFVHIVRNPYAVYASTRRHFRYTLPGFAWEPFDHLDTERITLEHYRLLMTGYLEQRDAIPSEDLIEVRYEEIVRNPLDVLESIYDRFDIGGWAQAAERIAAYLGEKRGYQRNRYQMRSGEIDRIRREWRFAFDEWKYDLPESIGIVD